jgi:isoleucyl-tRNA synthetase
MNAFSEQQADLVGDELNVKSVVVAPNVGDFVDYEIKANFKTLGPRFGKAMPKVAEAIARYPDPEALVLEADNLGTATIHTKEGDDLVLDRADLDVRIHPQGHRAFAKDGAYAVILDLDLTAELVAEGNAREVVRAIQDLRKSSGLAVEDRIELWIAADDAVRDGLKANEAFVSGEVLATSLSFDGSIPPEASHGQVDVEGGHVEIGLRKI